MTTYTEDKENDLKEALREILEDARDTFGADVARQVAIALTRRFGMRLVEESDTLH